MNEIGNIDVDNDSVIYRLILEHNREYLVRYSRKVIEDRKEDYIDINDL